MAFICAATDATALVIYRQVDAAGRVTFSDRPAAAPLEAAAIPTLDVAAALAGAAAMSSRHAAMIDANEAARRLRQAERERQRGLERMPGEHLPGAGTGDADARYQRRQEELRRVVELARRRSDEADRLLRTHP
jgi:hypothetical protein